MWIVSEGADSGGRKWHKIIGVRMWFVGKSGGSVGGCTISCVEVTGTGAWLGQLLPSDWLCNVKQWATNHVIITFAAGFGG